MRRRIDLPVLAAVLLAPAVFALTRGPEGSFDIWWHLATGRWIVEHRAVPHTDPFSYTKPDEPWIAHEWATDVLLYCLYSRWGLRGLALFRQLVAASTAVLLYLLCLRLRSHPLIAYGAGLFFVCFLGPTLNARPQVLLSLLFLLALHIVLSHRRGAEHAIWWLLPLAAVWANVHGGFIVLFCLLGLYAIDRAFSGDGPGLVGRLRLSATAPVILVGALCLLATLVNPNGLEGALYPLQYFVGETKWHTNVIIEYASPDFSTPAMAVPGLALIALLALLAASRHRSALLGTLVLLFFTYSFLRWQRMVAIFGVVALAALSEHLTAYLGLGRRTPSTKPVQVKPFFVWSVFLLAAVLAVAGSPWTVAVEKLLDRERYPLRPVEFATANGIKGNLLNTYRYGGYIIWQRYGERVVFIDGRADMYGRAMFEDYQTMVEARPGWKQLLERYDIAWVLIDRKKPLAKVLRLVEGWHLVYGDRRDVLFVRQGPPNEEVLRRWREGKLQHPRPDVMPRGAEPAR